MDLMSIKFLNFFQNLTMYKYLALSFFVFYFTLDCMAQSNKIDSHLQNLLDTSQSTQKCLISFHSDFNIDIDANLEKTEKTSIVYSMLNHNANRSQKEAKKMLINLDIDYKSFVIANCIYAKLDKEIINQLAKLEEVKVIAYNPSVMLEEPRPYDAIELREAEPEWGIKMINADSVWNLGYKGEGVIIAGQDTGYDWDNDVLINKYRGYDETAQTADHNYNWHDAIEEINPLHMDTIVTDTTNPCGLNLIIPCDDHNHGTHTMGTMVGSDTLNAIGVAPNSKWIACRNMERGYGSPATYLDCFEWFLAPTDLNGENPDPTKAPHVINNSWSCPEMEGCNESNWSILEEAVNNLKSAGVVVVVSAGNSGPNCNTVSTPAAMFENSFTVGATASNDTIARFSSRGTVTVDSTFRLKPNVSAPGVSVRSCIRNNEYRSFSGTSMAGPHVAGAVALIISANPNLAGKVEVIEDILESTAVAKMDTLNCDGISGMEIPNPVYGFGRIDVLAAVEQALQYSSVQDLPGANPFTLYPNPTSDKISIAFNERASAKIQLFSYEGKLLRTESLTTSFNLDLDLLGMPAGIYFIRVEQEGINYIEKFVKVD